MDSSYYTVLGWTVTIAGGCAAYYYYYSKDGRQREFRGRGARKDLSRAAAVAPVGDSARRKKQQDRPRPVSNRHRESETRASESHIAQPVHDTREEKENNAWAHDLAQKKKGTTLKAPAHAATRLKTVKQNSANSRSEELSAESSITDADDDISTAVSPALNGRGPNGRDVSDMLEAAAPGPSVLKLTEPTNPRKEKQKQQVKAAAPKETKKDRQNRKKAEEKKAQREADEKERRVLMESQRKTAREARGEPAKNGLGIAPAPAGNAWKATNGSAPISAGNTQLLDTFAQDDTTTTGSTAPTSVSASPVQPTNEKWFNGPMPSEEEQQRMLLEQDENAWVTVSKAKKGSKQANGAVQPVEVA
jgi:hypothetical protein